ncbi:YqjF family protein [Thalassorhabdus alkalitolerans]|uniref:YqjF family protein n=1 Tax=Thalassorhabdus alkalitolerans TaxID=2282697 RepID=A0ABW0YS86_9BACI|nr:DUF2071 domain-containing protein [Thalassobacillus sp. C254]
MSDQEKPVYLMNMTWKNVLFAHWSYPVEELQQILPEGMEVDTFEGRAYVGIVPFFMEDVRARFMPPQTSFAFPELNLRTYVKVNGEKGVYFFSLDASNPLAVELARRLFHLNYYHSAFSCETNGDDTRYVHQRQKSPARFVGQYQPEGEVFYSKPGTLEYFLTERYRLFSSSGSQLFKGDIHHSQWPLQKASMYLKETSLFEVNSLTMPEEKPHLLYSKGVHVLANRIRKVPDSAPIV